MLVGNDILDIYQLGNLQLLLNAIQSGRWHNPGFARSVWNALLVSDVISIGTFSLIIRLKLALLKPTRALSPLVVFSWSSSRRESFPTILYLLKLRTSLSQRRVCRRWRLLYWSGVGYSLDSRYRLPSWVPDWHAFSKNKTQNQNMLYEFDADKDLDAFIKNNPHADERMNLHIFGIARDSITRVEPRLKHRTDDFHFVGVLPWNLQPVGTVLA